MTEPCAIPALGAADVYSDSSLPVLSDCSSLSWPLQQEAGLVQFIVAKQVIVYWDLRMCKLTLCSALCGHARMVVTVFTPWLYALESVLQFCLLMF